LTSYRTLFKIDFIARKASIAYWFFKIKHFKESNVTS
jgi:hypothetical protein